MGDDGGEKDEGGGAQLHGFMLPDGHQHQIRAAVLLHPAGAVEKDDGQPAYRQQKDEAGVGLAQLGDKVDAVVKGDAHDPHQQPDHHGKDGPAQKIQKIQGLGRQQFGGFPHGGLISQTQMERGRPRHPAPPHIRRAPGTPAFSTVPSIA